MAREVIARLHARIAAREIEAKGADLGTGGGEGGEGLKKRSLAPSLQSLAPVSVSSSFLWSSY